MADNVKGITIEIGGDTSGLTKALGTVKKEINTTQKELQQVERLLKLDPGNTELLAQKQKLLSNQIDTTKNKLEALKNAKSKVDADMKNGTEINEKQYRELQREIVATEQSIQGLENAFEDMGDTAEKSLDKAEKGIEDVGKGSKGLDTLKSVGGGIAKGATVAVGAVAAVGAAAVAAAENTREYREDMNRLDAAFVNAGKTPEQARKAYEGFYSVLGESDRSVEAVNHLAQLTNNTKELEQWTTICAGVSATFGDSLPIEGLTEAANETAKVGAVTGPLADALNWIGISEEEFNKKLAATNSEEERATLITETLNSTYQGAAEQFAQLNADIMANREATLMMNEAMASIGAAVEPVVTHLKLLGAEALTSLADGLNLIMSGDITAGAETIGAGLAEIVNKITQLIPKVAEAALPIITSLATALIKNLPQLTSAAMEIMTYLATYLLQNLPQILQVAIDIITTLVDGITSQLPMLIPIAIEAIVQLINTFYTQLPMIIEVGINLIISLADGLINALPMLIEKIPVILDSMLTAFATGAPMLLSAGIELILKLAAGLIQAVPQLLAQIPQIISSIVKAFATLGDNIKSVGKNLVDGLWKGISNAKAWLLSKIKSWCGSILNGIKSFFGIKSPSRETMKIGKYLAEGMAIGIKQSSSEVSEEFKKILDDLKLQRDLEVISEKEYYEELAKLRNKYLEAGTSDWWNYTKELISYNKTLEEDFKDSFEEIAQTSKDKLDELEEKRQEFISNVRGERNMFTTITEETNAGEMTVAKLTDWKQETAYLNAYEKTLNTVGEKLENIFGGKTAEYDTLMQKIQEGGITPEGLQFSTLILQTDDESLKTYINDWLEYEKTLDRISNSQYEDEMQNIGKNLLESISEFEFTLPEKFESIGELTAEYFGDGLISKLSGILDNAKELITDSILNMGMGPLNTETALNSIDNSKTNHFTINVKGGSSATQNAFASKKAINQLLLAGVL